jgi:dimethylargininase
MIPIFSQAIVRQPCHQLVHALSTANLGLPDPGRAFLQHKAYVDALEICGLEVQVLGADERFPDATFVEDVALCTPNCAILTNPGAPSRNGERELMLPVLEEYYHRICEIHFPGTLDAGDVMMVGEHFFIGISERTNYDGAMQLIEILEQFGMTGQAVPLRYMLHLKTGVSYLEHNRLLVSGEFVSDPIFSSFERIVVPVEESYAANSLWINDKVLVPASCPKTQAAIAHFGYDIIPLEMSEFEKLDGGLSCLSLRF